MNWLPRIGWQTITPDEACELGLEHPFHFKWSLFMIEWRSYGISLMARAERMS